MRALATLLFLSLVPACASPIDKDGLTSIDDYASWERRVDAIGPVGGHGDSYRIMYANDIAETFIGSNRYPVGTVIVKEIRQIESGDTPGDIRYIAIMRKLSDAPPNGELDRNWLFTRAEDTGLEETHNARCWRTCHQASPFDGTFLDWSSAAR